MIHLTLTGIAAGMPICGFDKRKATATDNFAHFQYWCNWTHPDLCPKCAKAALADDDLSDEALDEMLYAQSPDGRW
jgi:hypothetical protein